MNLEHHSLLLQLALHVFGKFGNLVGSSRPHGARLSLHQGLIFLVVANARLSDRFRAEEYRERLRAGGVDTDERPDFLPIEDED